ncbi:hypothetical protein EDEG_02379 [Edhazardia aedis USNM 41457]|uniref:Uncharacterized protein n=1 Tax=Edhazardia aedis (strain USNM 41457) TaxID=1003232 RepID=J9D6W6_EDHAE|nr:hypothetical protein EDEG_02379 [Edhazardia aedis USNM 41457]|eukprot:EJW03264.1 hypothetical protein EDEG_02379 [Edhazardia aedis USNM 41457]
MSFETIYKELITKKNFFDANEFEEILKKIKTAENKEIESLSGKKTDQKTNSAKIQVNKKAEEHKDKGNEYFKKKDYQEAIFSYSCAIEEDKSNPVYYSNRAAAYACMNMADNGIDDCLKAIDLDPTYVKAYIRLGDFYSTSDPKKALDFYNKGLKYDEKNLSLKKKISSLEFMKNSGDVDSGLGGKNFEELFKDPKMMQMASEYLKNMDKKDLNNFKDLFNKK